MNGVLQSAPDGRMHAARVKPLGDQVAIQSPRQRALNCGALPGRRLRRRRAQLAVQRLHDQGIFVQVPEDFGDGRPRQLAIDAERLDRAQRAPPAVALHVRFGPRAGQRRAPVVERALLLQAGDCCVDLSGRELAASQSRPHLRFRQLAASEHLESGDVGVRHEPSLPASASNFGIWDLGFGIYRVTLVIVVWTERAISSRAMSPVVVMPAIRSLNSSTFDAQRSASSAVMICFSYSLYMDWSNVCIPYCDVPWAMAPGISLVLSLSRIASLM